MEYNYEGKLNKYREDIDDLCLILKAGVSLYDIDILFESHKLKLAQLLDCEEYTLNNRSKRKEDE